MTLQKFAEQFVASTQLILNPLIGHIFWDRLHLEALIKHPAIFKFKDGKFRLETIFSTIVSKCAQNPIAHEQITLRLQLVKKHCKEYFPAFYENRKQKGKNPFAYFVLRDHLTRLDQEVENQLWGYKKLSPYHNECKDFLTMTLALYYEKKFPTLKQCMLLAQGNNKIGYSVICNRIKEEDPYYLFFLTALAEPKLIAQRYKPLSVPLPANKATSDFETLIQLLLHNKRKAKCSFNILNELEINVEDRCFNVTQILKGDPDLSQTHLNKKALNNFVEMIRKEMEDMDLIYFWEAKSSLQLHKAQKAAFILYSTEKYVAKIQHFARNKGRVPTYDPKVIIKILLIMGVAASAQSTNTRLTTYRCDRLNKKVVNSRIQAILSKTSMREDGFFSTSTAIYIQDLPKKNVFTLCHAPLHQPNGFDIAKLSICEKEAEVSFPPGTRIHWLDYWCLDDLYFFSAVPVPTLGNEPSSYTNLSMFWHEIKIVQQILTTETQSLLQKLGIFQYNSSSQLTIAEALKSLDDLKQIEDCSQIIDHCIHQLSQVKKEKIRNCCQRLIRAKSYLALDLANQEITEEERGLPSLPLS